MTLYANKNDEILSLKNVTELSSDDINQNSKLTVDSEVRGYQIVVILKE